MTVAELIAMLQGLEHQDWDIIVPGAGHNHMGTPAVRVLPRQFNDKDRDWDRDKYLLSMPDPDTDD